MDEATRCDRLVLMREGAILADTTPAELLAETGAEDAEGAFLALLRRHHARHALPDTGADRGIEEDAR
jgi:ABC-2 type transport system ATP-binding protein